MTTSPLLTQAIRLQKTALDNAFSMYSAIQINGKDMLQNSLNQYPWMSDNWKQGYLTWASGSIQATENLKYLIDRGFQEIEKHLSESVQAAQDTPEKKPAPGPKKQATVKAAPKAGASPAQKKAAPKSTTQSVSTREEPVKKSPAVQKKTTASNTKSAAAKRKTTRVSKSRVAATGAAKKTVSRAKTAEPKKQSSVQPAKPAAEKQISTDKETTVDNVTTVDKQTPIKNREGSAAVQKETP